MTMVSDDMLSVGLMALLRRRCLLLLLRRRAGICVMSDWVYNTYCAGVSTHKAAVLLPAAALDPATLYPLIVKMLQLRMRAWTWWQLIVDVKRDEGDVSYSSMCPFKKLGGEYTSPLRHVQQNGDVGYLR